ncbi:unnamed protein product [Prorocentrum cordatum]|uniref:J domain-containing protein n=1 Tax=Prorocentrum cordatum TaxID=2364126 RepID=A0ABN9QF96_9DINO|nr:unnamed protein product [Polarella glacialis]
MLEDEDLPFGWEFDGKDAKLNDIYAEVSTRGMTPNERAALLEGKKKPNDPDALDGKVPAASPAASRLGRQLAMRLAAKNGWRFWPADVPAAFLHGRPHERVSHAKAVKSNLKFRKWIEDDMEHCGLALHKTTHWNLEEPNSTETNIKMQSGASILRPITIDQKNGDNDRPLMPEEIRHLRGFSERFSGRVNETLRFYKQNTDAGLKINKIRKVNDIVLAAMTAALIYDNVNINNDISTNYAGESAFAIDAKALHDAAKKEGITSFQDRRTGIEVLALRVRMKATQTQWKRLSPERQDVDGAQDAFLLMLVGMLVAIPATYYLLLKLVDQQDDATIPIQKFEKTAGKQTISINEDNDYKYQEIRQRTVGEPAMARERERARRWREADLYGALGVPVTATRAEVTRGFRRAALTCHPDKVPEAERARATRRFQLIAEAYEVLSDDALRRQYDAARPSGAGQARAEAGAPRGQGGPRRPAGPAARQPCNGCGRTHAVAELRKCPAFCTNVICPSCCLCVECAPPARTAGPPPGGRAGPPPAAPAPAAAPVPREPEARCAGCDGQCPASALKSCAGCPKQVCGRCELCWDCTPESLGEPLGMRGILLQMSFAEWEVDAAMQRCSSVEAAVEFLMSEEHRRACEGGWLQPVAAGAAAAVGQVAQLGSQLRAWLRPDAPGGAAPSLGDDPCHLRLEASPGLAARLRELGFSEQQAEAAALRCSSVEAAVDWLASNAA